MENASMNDKRHPELAKSNVIKHMPKACGDESAAVEFFERQRWGNSPVFPHCCRSTKTDALPWITYK
jgi:hypothetical protein